MVGVPGRSKGCLTCRKRKKGCDQRRPACTQCILGNRVCGGYGQSLQIVEWKACYTSNSSHHNNSAFNSSPSNTVSSNAISLTEPTLASFAIVDTTTTPPSPDPLLISLSHTSLQKHLLTALWTAHLPPLSLALSPFAELTTLTGWYEFLPSRMPEDPALRSAMLALSLAKLRTRDLGVEVLGRKVYGMALREVGRALGRDGKGDVGEEVLCACSMLALYEFFQASATISPELYRQGYSLRHNWMRHVKGLAVLVEARGPERYITGLGHRMLRGIRLGSVIYALQSRRATFFALPPWTTIPWTQHPKNLRDLLLDHLAAIPGLLERFDAIHGLQREPSPPPLRSAHPESDLRDLIQDLCSLSSALQSWSTDLETYVQQTSPMLAWPGTLLSAPLTAPPELYGLAHLTMIYWAACTVLYTTLRHAVSRLSSPTSLPFEPHTDSAASLLASYPNPSIFAANITAACTYFFRPELSIIAASNASFSVSIALLYYGARQDRSEWGELVGILSGLKREGKLLGFLEGVLLDLESEGAEESGASVVSRRWWGGRILGDEEEDGLIEV